MCRLPNSVQTQQQYIIDGDEDIEGIRAWFALAGNAHVSHACAHFSRPVSQLCHLHHVPRQPPES